MLNLTPTAKFAWELTDISESPGSIALELEIYTAHAMLSVYNS